MSHIGHCGHSGHSGHAGHHMGGHPDQAPNWNSAVQTDTSEWGEMFRSPLIPIIVSFGIFFVMLILTGGVGVDILDWMPKRQTASAPQRYESNGSQIYGAPQSGGVQQYAPMNMRQYQAQPAQPQPQYDSQPAPVQQSGVPVTPYGEGYQTPFGNPQQ